MAALAALALLLCYSLSNVLAQSTFLIDDTSTYSPGNPNGIQYRSGEWSSSNNNNSEFSTKRYLGTYHVTSTFDACFIFFFRGSGIQYYADKSPMGGDVSITLDGAGGQTSTVDGSSDTKYRQFQKMLWAWSGLDSGDHQVVICNPGEDEVGLDFFQVIPNIGSTDIIPAKFGPAAGGISTSAVVVNNQDQSIQYIGVSDDWELVYDYPREYAYFQGTVQTTTTPGDQCIFTFNGTAVWFFSTYEPGNAFVTINIDGYPSERVNTAPTESSGLRTQRLAWSKADLTPGSHVVTITHDGTDGQNMSVDFFKYLPRHVIRFYECASSSASPTQ